MFRGKENLSIFIYSVNNVYAKRAKQFSKSCAPESVIHFPPSGLSANRNLPPKIRQPIKPVAAFFDQSAPSPRSHHRVIVISWKLVQRWTPLANWRFFRGRLFKILKGWVSFNLLLILSIEFVAWYFMLIFLPTILIILRDLMCKDTKYKHFALSKCRNCFKK